MLSEDHAKAHVMKVLERLAPAIVENEASPGAADVRCSVGWIELKYRHRWPQGVVTVPHWSPKQKVWHTRQHLAGELTYVLLFCENNVLLFRGMTAVSALGKYPREQLFRVAVKVWYGSEWKKDLVSILRTEFFAHNMQQARAK